jgi:hypothetical protein
LESVFHLGDGSGDSLWGDLLRLADWNQEKFVLVFFLVVKDHLVHVPPSLTAQILSQAWNQLVFLLELQIDQKLNVLDHFFGHLIPHLP